MRLGWLHGGVLGGRYSITSLGGVQSKLVIGGKKGKDMNRRTRTSRLTLEWKKDW